MTDSLSRQTTFQPDDLGRPGVITGPGGSPIFDPTFDDNDNLTDLTSPEAGGYTETTAYSPVNLVESFTVPAGTVTITYDADHIPTGGSSPWGALVFDHKGRLTDVGDTHYELEDDHGILTEISTPDGTISFNGLPVPDSITVTGDVNATIALERDEIYQVTGITVGSEQIARDVDFDGVVTQAGDMTLTPNGAGLITDTTLGATSEHIERNGHGEVEWQAVTSPDGVVYRADYIRDLGGRVEFKAESIRLPNSTENETITTEYTYYPNGRLEQVTRNGAVVAVHGYL